MSPQTSEDVTKVMLPKPFLLLVVKHSLQRVNKKESTHKRQRECLDVGDEPVGGVSDICVIVTGGFSECARGREYDC